MLFKTFRIILFFILISLAALAQISVVYVWPGFFGELNLALFALVILFFFRGVKTSFIAALIGGFWLDLFSFNIFGANIISFLTALILLDKLSLSWLTNKSFYSFLSMNLMAIIVVNFLTGFVFYFSNLEHSAFFIFRSSFWMSMFYQMIWSFILSFLIFHLSSLVSRKLEPVFLEK